MGNETPSRVVGYYVIFPHIPEETIENNSFMFNIAKGEDWPKLATSTPREMYEGTVRMLMEYGATTMEHLELLAKLSPEERTFETAVEPLLTEEYEVDYALQTLFLKMLTDWPDCNRKVFDADLHHIKIMSAREHMEKLSNADFQATIKQLYDSKEGLNEWQLRLLEWYLLEVRASGLDRTDEKTRKLIGSWSKYIDEYRSKYISNIMATNDQVVYTITDKSMLKDAPPHVLQKLAVDPSNIMATNDQVVYTITDKSMLKDAPPHVLQKLAVDPAQWEQGPWRGRMTPHTIYPFMQYCSNRQLRAEAWEKWISKASFEHDFYNNSINVEELRHNNEGLAKTLGYSSVADHRLANKMAASPDTVRNFLNALTRRIRPVFIDRMESWTAFAQTREMMSGDLQPHDMAYICRREAEQHYDVDPLDLMNHFPFWPTFHNLTNIIGHIFGLQFKDITESGLERAHPDARIFSVRDMTTDEHLGRLYIDPYDRESKRGGWNTLLGRMESQSRGLDKLVYLVGSAIAPTENSPSLLHHQQLQQLLFHVGRAVQMLLSRSPYRDVAIPWAPFYASDWDAADMFPAFLQFFIYKPNLLQSLSSPHLISKSTISDEQANSICLALSRATLWESYRSLFWADYDLTIFEMEDRKQKFWLDLYREMSKEYFPFKPGKNDYQPCSFIPIFGLQPHMGMYYRKLWTEMLALDIHETFDYEDDVVKTGERLKATVLSRGSGDVAKELYRRFQGYVQYNSTTRRRWEITRNNCGYRSTRKFTSSTPDDGEEFLFEVYISQEHYLVVYYIMRSVCIREENLRSRLNFDQKQLRQLLAALKNEKLVKDRLLQQKNETGRNVSVIFYFINYRAIINVLKYKIDHMRQMLEAREKNELQKANYKCEQCGAQYEDMDIDRIFDPQTGTLKCWRCQGEVTQDITDGPTQVTSKPVEEAKVVPTWLQDDAIGGSEQDTTTDNVTTETDSAAAMPHTSSSVSLSLMAELEGVTEEPPAKKQRTSEGENGAVNGDAEEEEDDEEEEEMVSVAGKMVPLSEVTSEMVAEMTEEERDRYAAIMQENLYY
ncbi:hypothetical protein OESDEN_06270 [Oesophagostomum dentatum]|uniref:HTH TFE/IIEalpha-type domain-containing protein n=1 Tax=Oesophagostomum dentatum TaxID=61180 RepID=A0A0B1TDA5_OESDE|nr:hypothetical protein OESDEN_06270 [Oesophagostomum dentatum]